MGLTINGHLEHIHLSKPVGISEAWQVFVTERIHWCFARKPKAKTGILKMEQCCSCPYLLKGKKLEEMTRTSCTKMQCLGFSSKGCVGGWLIFLNCSSYHGRNSVGTFLFGLGETTCSAETVFLLDEEGKLSCMWWVFPLLYARLELLFLLQKAMPFLTPLFLCANDL